MGCFHKSVGSENLDLDLVIGEIAGLRCDHRSILAGQYWVGDLASWQAGQSELAVRVVVKVAFHCPHCAPSKVKGTLRLGIG